MKYKLINIKTKKEHLCDKVTIDGFDYYVSDELPSVRNKSILQVQGFSPMILTHFEECESDYEGKKVIATTNSNIDIPKVVDEVEEIIKDEGYSNSFRIGFKHGYNKSQETHPFSEEDVIEFAVWLNDTDRVVEQTKHIDFSKSDKQVAKELLQLWKEQQPKIVYYE